MPRRKITPKHIYYGDIPADNKPKDEPYETGKPDYET